jgi:hypothetical protein
VLLQSFLGFFYVEFGSVKETKSGGFIPTWGLRKWGGDILDRFLYVFSHSDLVKLIYLLLFEIIIVNIFENSSHSIDAKPGLDVLLWGR